MVALTGSTTMARKKMGRPKSSERHDVSIKFDKVLAGQARMISVARGVSMAEYLSEATRAIIERDYGSIMRQFEGGK